MTIAGVVVRGFRSSSVPVTHDGCLVESCTPLWGVGPRMSKTKMSNARMSNISVHVPRISNALTN